MTKVRNLVMLLKKGLKLNLRVMMMKMFYISMKEYFDEDEKTTFIYYVNESYRWITDSECSNYITRDKEKIEDIGPYNGGYIEFGNGIQFVRKR